jgi:DNA polymerase III subunit beta
MRFTCDRSALVDKLSVLARGVSTRGALPVLSGILLQVHDDRLEMFSTDMELSMRASMAVKAETAGDVVVPARLVTDVVRNMVGEEVTVEAGGTDDSSGVTVSAGAARFQLHAWPAGDFPQTSAFDLSEAFAVQRVPFLETLGKVGRAASRDDNRPILTGVLVSIDGSTLRMVATDSYRLAVKQSPLETGPAAEVQAIVPVKALNEVARLAAAVESETISVVVGQNQAVFGIDDLVLATRLIEGQFPNYNQLIPDTFDHTIELNREAFLGVVRRVGLLAQKNAPLRLKFMPAGRDDEGEERPAQLLVRAITQDVGQAQECIDVPFTAAESFEIGFNHLFLIDGAESVEGPTLTLKLISPLRPGLLSGAESGDFLYLIMPIRLSS